jgi:hypothetical protein
MIIDIPLVFIVGTIRNMLVIALLAMSQLVGLIQAEVAQIIITAFMCTNFTKTDIHQTG